MQEAGRLLGASAEPAARRAHREFWCSCWQSTFAGIDWVMSLEPHWFSTMYGVIFVVGGVLKTFAFMIILTMSLTSQAGDAGDGCAADFP